MCREREREEQSSSQSLSIESHYSGNIISNADLEGYKPGHFFALEGKQSSGHPDNSAGGLD